MKQRGRQSAAAMAVAVIDAPPGMPRLAAPAHLSDAERAVWAEVVNDQPAEVFTVTHAPLLEMYCRHIVQARVLADELLHFERSWLADKDGLARYDKLLKMNEREARAASSLATRLRITRQAVEHRYTAAAKLGAGKTRKPWELPSGN